MNLQGTWDWSTFRLQQYIMCIRSTMVWYSICLGAVGSFQYLLYQHKLAVLPTAVVPTLLVGNFVFGVGYCPKSKLRWDQSCFGTPKPCSGNENFSKKFFPLFWNQSKILILLIVPKLELVPKVSFRSWPVPELPDRGRKWSLLFKNHETFQMWSRILAVQLSVSNFVTFLANFNLQHREYQMKW